MPLSVVSVRTYQTFLPDFVSPRYSGRVMVPFCWSMVPEFSSWTGPTSSFWTFDGEGPK